MSVFAEGVPVEYAQPVRAGSRKPMGFQQITVLTSAVGLVVPPGARYAIIQPTGQPVRWRDDGANPTAAIGMRVVVGADLEYVGDLTAIKFIQEAATAVLNVSFYA